MNNENSPAKIIITIIAIFSTVIYCSASFLNYYYWEEIPNQTYTDVTHQYKIAKNSNNQDIIDLIELVSSDKIITNAEYAEIKSICLKSQFYEQKSEFYKTLTEDKSKDK